MIPKVYLFKGNLKYYGSKVLNKLALFFKKGEKIAIKLHFGEPGNKTSFTTDMINELVSILIQLEIHPILFDSPVAYNSIRNDVKTYEKWIIEKGFNPKFGYSIQISDKGVMREGINICKTLIDLDGIIILSHVTGHLCLGMGAALKNIGMGGVTKLNKEQIHNAGTPIIMNNCTLCGNCIQSCPENLISISGEKLQINLKNCLGCSNCCYICPIQSLIPNKELFDQGLINAVKIILKNVKKYYCINYLLNITEDCDCIGDPGPIISKDVGILLSDDIVAIDKASYDLLCLNLNEDCDVFKKDPLIHIKLAEEKGLGSLKYQLIKM